jgi:hypothetical protein
MAAYTSTQSGNWNLASTWGGAGVPGNLDTATIASTHVVSVTDARIIGASGVAGTLALTIQTSGTLKIDAGTLRVRGDVSIGTTTSVLWDAVWLLNGGTFKFDATLASAPTTTHYRAYASATNVQCVFRDSSTGARNIVTSDTTGGAAMGWFDTNFGKTLFNVWGWNCTNTDFSNLCGTSTQPATGALIGFWLSGKFVGIVLSNCTFTNCGDMDGSNENLRTADAWDLSNTTFSAGLGIEDIRFTFAAGTPTATRSHNGAVFDKRPFISGAAGLNGDNTIFNDAFQITPSDTSTPTPLSNVFHRTGVTAGTPNAEGSSGIGLKDSVLVHGAIGGPGNPHGLSVQAVAYDLVFDGNIIEQIGDDVSQADMFLYNLDTAAAQLNTHRNYIKLPNAVGSSSGNVANIGGAHRRFVFEHGTAHLGSNEAGAAKEPSHVLFDEFTGAHADMVVVRSCLGWDTTGRGFILSRNTYPAVTTVTDVALVANLHHNGAFNVSAVGKGDYSDGTAVTTPRYSGLKFSGAQATKPGANDVVGVDPQFVDPTRCLSKWDHSLAATVSLAVTLASAGANLARATRTAHGLQVGDWVTIAGAATSAYNVTARIVAAAANTFDYAVVGTLAADSGNITKQGSVAHAIAELSKRNLSTFDSRYTVPALVAYIRAGFTPQVTAYQTTAHDGTDIGAVAVRLPNLGITLLAASNAVAKTAASQASVVSATGITWRRRMLGAALAPPGNRVLADIGDGTANSGHTKCSYNLVVSGGTVVPYINAGGLTPMGAGYAASLIDPTKWYEVLWQFDSAATTNKRKLCIWEAGTTTRIYDYTLSIATALPTTAGYGIISIGTVASENIYGAIDQSVDFEAWYAGSPYDTYNTALGPPALPTGTDAGIIDCWSLDDGTGTSAANAVAAGPALQLTSTTWIAGYGYVPGPVASIVVSQQPNTTTTTVAHTQAPIVSTLDARGIPTPDTSSITATLVTVTGSGTIQGTTTRAAVAGVDPFTDLTTRSDAGGTFRYHFTLGALTVDTAVFTVNPPGPPIQMVFTRQPSASALTGVAFATQPMVELRDQLGAVCVNYVGNVALGFYTGGLRGTLSGTLTKAVVSGVADFAGLGVKITGNGNFRLAPSNTDITAAKVATPTLGIRFPVLSTAYVQIYSGAAATQAMVYPYEAQGLQVGDTVTFRSGFYDSTRALTTPPSTPSYASDTPSVLTVNASTGVATAVGVGVATVTMTATGFTKTCVVNVFTANGVPVLPQTTLATSEASTPCSATRVFTPATLAALQACATNYRAGDKIMLAPSFTGSGVVTFTRDPTDTSTNDWCWVTVSGAMPCPEGTRVAPSAALPTILSTGTASSIVMGDFSGQIRFRGIKADFAPGAAGNNYPLIAIGDGTENTVLMMPHNVIIDRCVINNTTTTQSSRGVQPNCRRFACVDTYIGGFHAVSSYESQAIGCWQAMGPFKIDNCYTSGSDETIATGSDAQSIPVQIADVTITGTLVDKDPLWRTNGTGTCKNGIEFKKMLRALIRGVWVRNAWLDGQTGQAFFMRSGDDVNDMADVITRDVSIEYSVTQNTHQLFQFDPGYAIGEPNLRRVRVRHVIGLGLGQPATQSLGGTKSEYVAWGVVDSSDYNGPAVNNTAQDLTLEHITAIGYNSAFGVAIGLVQDAAGNAHQMPGLKIKNSILASYSAGAGYGPTFYVGPFTDQQWVRYGGGVSANFAGNVLPGATTTYASEGTNYRPASLTAVGFVGGATAAIDVNAALTDLALSGASSYKGLATDGADPGADIATVVAETMHTISGVPSSLAWLSRRRRRRRRR